MRARHRFVLENTLLPVSQRGPFLALILQFRPLQRGTVKVLPSFPNHVRRNDHLHVPGHHTRTHQPEIPGEFFDHLVAPLVRLQPKRTNQRPDAPTVPHLLFVQWRFFGIGPPGRQGVPFGVPIKRVQTDGKTEGVQDLVLDGRKEGLEFLRLRAYAVRTQVGVPGDGSGRETGGLLTWQIKADAKGTNNQTPDVN